MYIQSTESVKQLALFLFNVETPAQPVDRSTIIQCVDRSTIIQRVG